jgi:hypothetical protein
MIVSFKNNFIFIKTRKTAGTTVEIALTPSCGPDDMLTLISPEDELLRLQNGKVAARNYSNDPRLEERIAKSIIKRDAARLMKRKKRSLKRGALKNHSSALEIKEKVSEVFWDSCFKFTIERHPYEKVISDVYWASRRGIKGDLSRLIDDKIAGRRPDRNLYSIDGKVVVDEIIRQETLEVDLYRIGDKMGLTLPSSLPNAKSSFRTDPRPATEILTAEQKKRIYERNRQTFELLGYEP